MSNSLEQLKATGTICVADTGDFTGIKKYKPQDATTNPSLILKAAQKEEYAKIVDRAVKIATANAETKDLDKLTDECLDILLVEFGQEILKIVPGRVSTEVDASMSYDTEASINKAKKIIELYKKNGIDKERVLVKIASTWEGINAAKFLENEEKIHCNLTLMFSIPQAVAAAEAGATLVSPFVGRILDWNKKKGREFPVDGQDPGVSFVRTVFNYYKHFSLKTQVLGASFRNIGEIRELAGCDLLTMSPNFLEDLENDTTPMPKKLDAEAAKSLAIDEMSFINDEGEFRKQLAQDEQATYNLKNGIDVFKNDTEVLKDLLRQKLSDLI